MFWVPTVCIDLDSPMALTLTHSQHKTFTQCSKPCGFEARGDYINWDLYQPANMIERQMAFWTLFFFGHLTLLPFARHGYLQGGLRDLQLQDGADPEADAALSWTHKWQGVASAASRASSAGHLARWQQAVSQRLAGGSREGPDEKGCLLGELEAIYHWVT